MQQSTIDRDEDGVWVVECPAIPGSVSQGTTKEEAVANVEDAIRACLQVRSERGMPLTAYQSQLRTSHFRRVAERICDIMVGRELL